jgi:uncharacterized phage-associated protein
MPHRAVAIANEFLKVPGASETLTQMQLQKLVYFANGWNWALNDERLVSDDAEAWSFGPVYRDLYNHTKYFGREPIGRQITPDDSEISRIFGDAARNFGAGGQKQAPYSANATASERLIVRHVWHRYGALSGIRLSALTHQPGTPWFEAYQRGRNSLLDQDTIRTHYGEIADRSVPPAA